jgi:DNA polymerase III alpha subunit
MGIVTLEDLSGKVEAVLFSEKLPLFRDLVVPDALLFLDGEVDRKREEPSLRVNNVIPAEGALEALAKLCVLEVRAETEVPGLLELLRRHKGTCPVHLDVRTGDGAIAEVACGNGLRIACTTGLLGDLMVQHPESYPRVIGPSRRPIPLPRLGTGPSNLRQLAVPA